MRKLSRFEKFGLVAAILIACTFFYVKRVYEPQEARLKKTVDALNKVIGQINNLKEVPPQATVRNSLKAHREEIEALNGKLDGSLIRMGSDKGVTRLLSDINGKMVAHGLEIATLVPGGKVEDGLLSWNSFRIDMAGSYYGLLAFMRDLHGLKDAVKIQDLQMEKLDDQRLKITFNLMF